MEMEVRREIDATSEQERAMQTQQAGRQHAEIGRLWTQLIGTTNGLLERAVRSAMYEPIVAKSHIYCSCI